MNALWIRRLKIGVIGLMAVAIFGFVVMGLWNWLAPAVFGLRTVTFWQALGMLILSKILFGGFRGRPGHGGQWKRRMSERWQQMSPEEREKFRRGFRPGMMTGCGPNAPVDLPNPVPHPET